MKKTALFLCALFVLTAFSQKTHAFSAPEMQEQTKVVSKQAYPTVVLFKANNLTLTATPFAYDPGSGKWNYQIAWERMPHRSGSIYINGNLFVSEAFGLGKNYTGYHLNPNSSYRVVYFSQPNGKGVRIANSILKTLSAEHKIDKLQPPAQDAASASDIAAPSPALPVDSEVRVGQLVVLANSAVNLVGNKGLIGIPSLAVFNSWCFNFAQAVRANSAEQALPQIGILGLRAPGQALPEGVSKLRVSTCPLDKGNQKPVITAISGPTAININQLNAWVVHVYDPDSSYFTYGVNWGETVDPLSSVAKQDNTSNQPSFTHSYSGAGKYTITFTVTDNHGATAQSSLSVLVDGHSDLQIVTSSLPDALVGQSYSTQIEVNGGKSPYIWTTISTTYPSGCCVLGLVGNSEPISGKTVTFNTQSSQTVVGPVGNYTWIIQVQDANGHTVAKILPLTILP